MANHTPGPWRHEESLLVIAGNSDTKRIVAGCWGHSEELLPEGYANARLIAAAPDMLAALKAALTESEDGLRHLPCGMPECWMEAAEAAIAKAEGRTDGR